MRAAGLLEEHFRNVKDGKNETIILTNRDLANYVEKVQLKSLKKLLAAYQDGTAEVVREIRQVAASQAKGFDSVHDALKALRADILLSSFHERVICTDTQIICFTPIKGLSRHPAAAGVEVDNTNHNAPAGLDLSS